MESTLLNSSSCSSLFPLISSSSTSHQLKTSNAALNFPKFSIKTSIYCSASSTAISCSSSNKERRIASVESQFRYDTLIPEQKIDEPVGLSVSEKEIGHEQRCGDCQAKGAVLCATCDGSGLYVDSVMECQGIFVKVRCLGCGGTGNIMCSECGGRGHL